jgi:hypothetical protein
MSEERELLRRAQIEDCPKRIWFDPEPETRLAGEEHQCADEVAYIRADLVQDLIDALRECQPHSGHAENLIDIAFGHFEDLEML